MATLTATRTLGRLAGLAETPYPDRPDSPGAQFLRLIEGRAQEVLEDPEFCGDPEYDGLVEDADSLVPVYTHDRWATFVDLAAYRENVSDYLAGPTTDLTEQAGVALYIIAERLLQALLREALG